MFDIQCVVEASSFSLNHNMTLESKENYPRHTKTVQNSLGFNMPEVKPLHKPRGDLVLCALTATRTQPLRYCVIWDLCSRSEESGCAPYLQLVISTSICHRFGRLHPLFWKRLVTSTPTRKINNYFIWHMNCRSFPHNDVHVQFSNYDESSSCHVWWLKSILPSHPCHEKCFILHLEKKNFEKISLSQKRFRVTFNWNTIFSVLKSEFWAQ